MAIFALFLMGGIFIVLSQQSKMQKKERELLLPALSPIQSRSLAKVPKWITELQADGKVHIISFWASWCEPCKEDLPFFEKLQKSFGREKLEIHLVNLDYSAANVTDAKKMMVELAPNLKSVYEDEQNSKYKIKLKAIPYHTLIDTNGRVAMSFYAPLAKYQDVFKRRVQALLDEKASP